MQNVDRNVLQKKLGELAWLIQTKVNLVRKLNDPRTTKRETKECQLWTLENRTIPGKLDEINKMGGETLSVSIGGEHVMQMR